MVHVQSMIDGTRREPTDGIDGPRPADEIQQIQMMVTEPVWSSLHASGSRARLLAGQTLVQVRSDTGPL